MCGIAGIVDYKNINVSVDLLKTYSDSIIHRGPDSSGIYQNRHVGLVSRRLAVTDLSAKGSQPISDSSGIFTIVFNGEIYNHKELKKNLEEHGYSFVSQTDTEVILYAYICWGEDFLEKISGMFAFAIWNKQSQSLFIARDRLGVKPFFYVLSDTGISFSSEVHSLYEGMDIALSDIDDSALYSYLAFGVVPIKQSFVKGVNKLQPGSAALFDRNGITVKCYWKIDTDKDKDISYVDALKGVDSRLTESVATRLNCDVPIGCFLSGGIDSGIVTAIASKIDTQLSTFSVGFEGVAPENDELVTAKQVAKALGTNHHEMIISPYDIEVLPKLIYNAGEPFADVSIIPSCHLARVTRNHVTVALGGDGGDELFAGYRNVYSSYLAERIKSYFPYGILRILKGIGEEADGLGNALSKMSRFIGQYIESPIYMQYNLNNHWNDEYRRRLLSASKDPENLIDPIDYVKTILNNIQSDLSVPEQHLYVDLHHRLPSDYLVKLDIASNLNSLEIRSPFMDKDLVEFAQTIPVAMKLKGGRQKSMLRELAKQYLPEHVSTKKKVGFSPDLSGWFRGKWRYLLYEMVLAGVDRRGLFDKETIKIIIQEHVDGRHDHSQRLWELVCLEIWMILFIDKQHVTL